MEKLLTQQDVADRWQVTVQSIENWRKEGTITPCKDVPVIRFTEQHILELEGVKLEKVSPLAYRRLEKELEQTKQENVKLKSILTKITMEASQIYIEEA